MLSCLSPRNPCSGPNAALSLRSRSAASASRLCVSSRVTRDARAAAQCRASCEFEGERVAMVKVGLAGRMSQRPVGLAAILLIDDHRHAYVQRTAHVRRPKAWQVDERVQIEAPRPGLDDHLRIEAVVRKR